MHALFKRILLSILVACMPLILLGELPVFLILLMRRLAHFLAWWAFERLDIWFKGAIFLFDGLLECSRKVLARLSFWTQLVMELRSPFLLVDRDSSCSLPFEVLLLLSSSCW
jgi:hypothetical protein